MRYIMMCIELGTSAAGMSEVLSVSLGAAGAQHRGKERMLKVKQLKGTLWANVLMISSLRGKE